MERILEFKCPECQSHTLEEVLDNVVVLTTLSTIYEEEGEFDFQYGSQINEHGNLVGFQCAACGQWIADGHTGLLKFLTGDSDDRQDRESGS